MLLTRLPLGIATPFDLHALGTPPAFILSQDQTLHTFSLGLLHRAYPTDWAKLRRLTSSLLQAFCLLAFVLRLSSFVNVLPFFPLLEPLKPWEA